jgi:hypothetical protein
MRISALAILAMAVSATGPARGATSVPVNAQGVLLKL